MQVWSPQRVAGVLPAWLCNSPRALGILGHASLLAGHAPPTQSSPVERGAMVRTRMLCQTIPDPPADLMVVPPDPAPGLTTRERYGQHTADPFCSGCHQLMDPIGFGFEHFDTVGKYRSHEEGKPIDATGNLIGSIDADGEFDGLDELSVKLAASEDLRRCLSNKWFEFAFKRPGSTDSVCSVNVLNDALAQSNNDLRELMVALTRTDAFRFRAAIVAGEEN